MTEERKGESFAFAHAFIWGLFPIITVLSYKVVPSLVSLTISTLFASIPFLFIIIHKHRLSELRNPLLWKYIGIVIIFSNLLYYCLYFFGLTKTTPGNASLLALFEVFTSYVFFHMIRKEHFSFESKIGSACMILGAVIILAPNFSSFNVGDIFILAATIGAPIGNLFQQKAKRIASTETILFLRHTTATPILFIVTILFSQSFKAEEIKSSLMFLILNGVLILGISKIFWIEGISRVPVTKAIALSSLAPLFTLGIAWFMLDQTPTIWQAASLGPFFFGVLLLTDNLKISSRNKIHNGSA